MHAPTAPTPAPYRLVCLDWDGVTDVGRRLDTLRTRLGSAVLAEVTDTVDVPTHVGNERRTVTRYTFTLDGNQLRNTHAHDLGCRFGFVVHTETALRTA